MTNAELISKIKAEIERLKGIGGVVPLDNREQKTGYESALIDVETFLDTLESEKPMNQDGLMEEVKRYYSDNFDYISSDQPTLSILTNIARHFAQWQKEQMLKEAVEGDYDCQYMTPAVFLDKYLDGIKDGDKVRIIIVKEDEK